MISVARYTNLWGYSWSRIFCSAVSPLYKFVTTFVLKDFLYGSFLLIQIFGHVCCQRFSIARFAPNRNLLACFCSRIFYRAKTVLQKIHAQLLLTDFLYGRLLLIEIFCAVCAHEFSIERFASNTNLCSRLWSQIFCRAKTELQKFRANVCTQRFSVEPFAPNTNLLRCLCPKIFCSTPSSLYKSVTIHGQGAFV